MSAGCIFSKRGQAAWKIASHMQKVDDDQLVRPVDEDNIMLPRTDIAQIVRKSRSDQRPAGARRNMSLCKTSAAVNQLFAVDLCLSRTKRGKGPIRNVLQAVFGLAGPDPGFGRPDAVSRGPAKARRIPSAPDPSARAPLRACSTPRDTRDLRSRISSSSRSSRRSPARRASEAF